MMDIISELISTVIQIIAFALVPFLFFLFRKDKSISFFQFIGLYKPTGKSLLYVSIIALLFLLAGIGLTYIDESVKQAILSPNSVAGKIRLLGFSASTVLIILLIGLFKTSFAEEILFRGFLGKQLIAKLGFAAGNSLQAVLFGLVHLLLFWGFTKATFLPLALIFIFSTSAGWTIGLIKNKYSNGSIVPGWITHGLGNTLSYMIIAFLL